MGSPRIYHKKYPFTIKNFPRIVKNENFHYLKVISHPRFGPLMMFDMYVSMSFGLSIGALTFYWRSKPKEKNDLDKPKFEPTLTES